MINHFAISKFLYLGDLDVKLRSGFPIEKKINTKVVLSVRNVNGDQQEK